METTDAERTARLLRIAALSPEAHNAMRAAMDLVMSMFDPDSPDIGVIISIGPIEGGSPGRSGRSDPCVRSGTSYAVGRQHPLQTPRSRATAAQQ